MSVKSKLQIATSCPTALRERNPKIKESDKDLPRSWIFRCIWYAKRCHDVLQLTMFPTDQNVAGAIIVLDFVSDSLAVIAVDTCVDWQIQSLG